MQREKNRLQDFQETTGLQSLQNEALVSQLRRLVQSERRITAEIIGHLKEIAGRRLYLEYGHTSLFAFLTCELGYSAAAAQRRIDAARLMQEVPSLKEDLKSGVVNLTQVSMIAQSIRQKEKEAPRLSINTEDKKTLLCAIKNQDTKATQKILAQTLGLELKTEEKQRVQKDNSVRAELTFSPEQMALINRVKELISHTHLNPSLVEVIELLAKDFIKRKDPLVVKRPSDQKAKSDRSAKADGNTKADGKAESDGNSKAGGSAKSDGNEKKAHIDLDSDGGAVVAHRGSQSQGSNSGAESVTESVEGGSEAEVMTNLPGSNSAAEAVPSQKAVSPIRRKPIRMTTRRQIFQKDQCCQWKDEKTGKICGSKFQLQIDHLHPVWAGGSNDPSNLQVLCRLHNALKFRKEVGLA